MRKSILLATLGLSISYSAQAIVFEGNSISDRYTSSDYIKNAARVDAISKCVSSGCSFEVCESSKSIENAFIFDHYYIKAISLLQVGSDNACQNK